MNVEERMHETYLLAMLDWDQIKRDAHRHPTGLSQDRIVFGQPLSDEEVIQSFIEEQSVPPRDRMPVEFLYRREPQFRSPGWRHVNRIKEKFDKFSLKDFEIFATTGFTDFYCDASIAGASNLNAGSTNTGAASYTAVGDSDGTSVFTPSDGSNPVTQGVATGNFVSIYVTAGATVATFISRVTAVTNASNGAITVSTTAKSGTIPTNSAGAHTITLKLGGTWKGPNGSVAFPFNFVTSTLANTATNLPYVNLKANSGTGGDMYAITAAMTHSNNLVGFGGYTTSARDGGRAVIDGGNGTFAMLAVSGSYCIIADMVFQNTTTVSGSGLGMTGGSGTVNNVISSGQGMAGLSAFSAGTNTIFIQCEAFSNGKANTSQGGFYVAVTGITMIRCYSHNNTGSNINGMDVTNTASAINLHNCMFTDNTLYGIYCQSFNVYIIARGCEFYNNGSDGIRLNTSGNQANINFENCNFIKNGGWGLNVNAGNIFGFITNCGVAASGSTSNTSGDFNIPANNPVRISGTVTYTANTTPYNAPTTGDFRLVGAAQNAGCGTFTETGNSKTGTVGYPDIGAAQHQSATSGGGAIIGSSIITPCDPS